MLGRTCTCIRNAISLALASLIVIATAAPLKPRVVAMTDINTDGEPDDTQSLVRLLAYADVLEIEGIVANGGWNGDGNYEEIEPMIGYYGQDVSSLRKRSGQSSFLSLSSENGTQEMGYWPSETYLQGRKARGNIEGISNVGSGKDTDGSELIRDLLLDASDDRPIWFGAWGGCSSLGQALWRLRDDYQSGSLSQSAYEEALSKVRLYTIRDQDVGKGSSDFTNSVRKWILENFPGTFVIWCEQQMKGITDTPRDWYQEHIQGHGALGAHYPDHKWGVEGDTPSFLYAMLNGLSDPEHPQWGSWGGRYPYGQSSNDGTYQYTDELTTGKVTNDFDSKEPIGRYKTVINDDFAARMDWAHTGSGNRNPVLTVQGDGGREPLVLSVSAGTSVNLSASGTDPEGHSLSYTWWQHRDVGYSSAVNISSPNSASTTVEVPSDAGNTQIHLIVTVKDNGTPALVDYRRVLLATDGSGSDPGNQYPTVSITNPSDGAGFTAGSDILIEATASDNDGSVSKVEFYQGSTKLGEDASSPYGYTWTGVAEGSYTLTAKAIDNEGASTVSNGVSISVTSGTSDLPSPWVNADIGSVGAAGSASYANGTFTVNGSGDDIWNNADEFHFVYQGLSGDGEIVARVTSIENTNSWAKAGVMIRESLADNSKHAMMVITPGNGSNFQYRSATGGSMSHTNTSASAPDWVRLVRSGSTLTGYRSEDGGSWSEVGSVSITMASSVYVGLAVTSHNDGTVCTAEFTDVTLGGSSSSPSNQTPTVSITNPSDGAGFTAGSEILIEAAASDNDGSVTLVEFFAGSTKLGEDPSSPYSYTWTGAPEGSYTLTAKATDDSGATTTSSGVSISVTSSTSDLPSPWVNADVGAVGLAGSASYTNGSFTVNGSGDDIWGSEDDFHFVYQGLSGDGEIVARVSGVENTGSTPKAGVMMREVLTEDAKYMAMMATSGSSLRYQYRTSAGSSSRADKPGGSVPMWVKVTRTGSTFEALYSSDGSSWTSAGAQSISMATTIYMGLVVNAHENSTLNTSTFTGVSVNGGSSTPPGNESPTVSITSPADGAGFAAGSDIVIEATASDNDGSVTLVEFFAGSTKLGEDPSSPYSYTWTGAPEGSYTLTAKANDDSGAVTTSSGVSISVTASTDTTDTTSGDLITDLSVASGKTYVLTTLEPGIDAYIDRSYTFSSIGSYGGMTYIRTANDDKGESEESFLTFTLSTKADVYVAYDSRAGSLPDWLSSWTATGEHVDVNVQLNTYTKTFDAGSVTLGGNAASGASGAGNMYVVMAKAAGIGKRPAGRTPSRTSLWIRPRNTVIDVYNLHGRVVLRTRTYDLRSGRRELPSRLAKGIYLLRWESPHDRGLDWLDVNR